MACFLGKARTFLPSPIVARKTWGSKSRRLLATGFVPAALRVVWGMRSIADRRPILLLSAEALGWKVRDMGTSVRRLSVYKALFKSYHSAERVNLKLTLATVRLFWMAC